MPACPACGSTAALRPSNNLCEACLLEETLSSTSAAPDEEFGTFKLLCEIGEGGLGTVYLAEQLRPIRREVALKVLKSGSMSREVLKRFQAESQLLAIMDHPHIAHVLDAGTSSAGRPFLVMEYVDGQAITIYCDLHRLRVRERLMLFIDVCAAVEHAHRKNILHRDLKPSNILIGEHEGRPAPKIIDFGIAKALGRLTGDTLQTEAGHVLGTIEYMSPEQAGFSTRALDATTDVYALGVVLYELLCGALPFDSERLREAGLASALRILVDEEPPLIEARLRQLGPGAEEAARKRQTSVTALKRDLSGDLGLIVRTALDKDPARRYPSADALASDIERYLRAEPLRVHAPGLLYRARKLVQRRSGSFVTMASMFAILGTAVFFALSYRVSRPLVPKVSPLTSYPGYEFHPALSPDGKRLAFVWNGESDNYDVYVKPLDGGEPLRLTRDQAHDLHPSWSPDGRFIAFLRTSPTRKEAFIVPASGGPERKVIDVSTTEGSWETDASVVSRSPGPAWSPDGATLAIGNRQAAAGPDCIYLVSLRSGTSRKLTSPEPDSLGDSLPVFSPGGRYIAFVRANSQRGITDVFRVPVSGGEAKRITFDRKTISGLAWASEKRIVFTSNRWGGNRLWSIPAQGGTPELIPVAARNVRDVSVSGQRLVLAEFFRNTNIWRAGLSRRGAAPEKLIATTRRNDSPKYSPDGSRIVFGSDRSGDYELWMSAADGSHARQITSFGGLPVGTPHWSPDGRQIVFDSVKDGRSAIYIVNAEGGMAQLFEQDRWDCMMPSWSRDGKHIYFAARPESDVLRVWKKPIHGGPAVQITYRAGGEAVEAPNGRVVYFSDGRNGVWQVSPDGSNEGPVPGLEQIHHSRYFDMAGTRAYFLRDERTPGLLEYYDFATHRTTPLVNIEKRILYKSPGLSVSPDERWLLYAQVDDSGSDVLMLEDFQ